jgi:hypothetical protein
MYSVIMIACVVQLWILDRILVLCDMHSGEKKCFQWKISRFHNSSIINIIHSFNKTDRVPRRSFSVGEEHTLTVYV